MDGRVELEIGPNDAIAAGSLSSVPQPRSTGCSGGYSGIAPFQTDDYALTPTSIGRISGTTGGAALPVPGLDITIGWITLHVTTPVG